MCVCERERECVQPGRKHLTLKTRTVSLRSDEDEWIRALTIADPVKADTMFVLTDSDVMIVELETGQPQETLNDLDSANLCACIFNVHHNLFVCASSEASIKVWSLGSRTRFLVGQLQAHVVP